MAVRRKTFDSDQQLDLFSSTRPAYDTTDPIRPNGRETLARIPSENGSGNGSQGPPASDAPGSGGEDEGRNGRSAHAVQEAGIDTAAGPRPGLGNGEGELHPPSTRVLTNGQSAP